MFKSYIKLGVLLLLGFIMLSSCNDEYTDDKKVNNNTVVLKTLSTPENPENPYDSVGYWHNIFADQIYPQLTSGSEIDESINISCDYFYSQGYDTTHIYSIVHSVNNNMGNFYFNNIESLNISNESKSLLRSLLVDFAAMLVDENITEYEVYKAFIIDYEETQVINNSNITTNDKAIILSTTSILRYSLYYWMNNNGFITQSKATPGWLKVLAIIGADVVGGAVASAVGATGPAAACVSVAVGALMAEKGEATVVVDEPEGKVTIIVND